jgi:hypothetical protein
MTSIRKPYGYRDNRPDEKNQPTQKKENSKIKQNLIYIGFIALIIFGMYYFMSPYQNCIRLGEEVVNYEYQKRKKNTNFKREEVEKYLFDETMRSKGTCLRATSW